MFLLLVLLLGTLRLQIEPSIGVSGCEGRGSKISTPVKSLTTNFQACYFMETSMRAPFHVLAIFLLLSGPFGVVKPNSEGDALFAFRRAVKDPSNVLQSWDPTLVDPCTWFHVTCDDDKRVTRLDLGHAKLSGHLVPELGRLQRLQFLELYKNDLKGPIPKELGDLKNLVSLGLYQNNLTGSIPASLSNLSNIKFLRLNSNMLTGRIPRELTKLGSLKILDLSNNDLCGTFPTSGSFSKFSEQSFKNNTRLKGPELMGFVRYDTGESCK